MNDFLLATLCANMAMVPGNVCGPTSHALSQQVGLQQNVSKIETIAITQVKKSTPETMQTMAAYGATAYRFNNGQEARIGFKVPDFCDRLEIGGSKTGQNITFKWNF